MAILIILKLKKVDKMKGAENRKNWIYRTIHFNLFLGVLVIVLSIVIRDFNPTIVS